MGCVYKISNKINKKCYVGLTVNTAEARLKKHKSMVYSGGCSALYYAMSKYGCENFEVSVLFESVDRDELMVRESMYIAELKTLAPSGYNLTSGGENCKVSEKTKLKMSKKMKGRKITWGDKVSVGVKRLWEDPEYRAKQTKQRHEKRGSYRKGIVKEKLRKKVDINGLTEDYFGFMTAKNIAKKYKISVCTLYRIIDRENITKRGHK